MSFTMCMGFHSSTAFSLEKLICSGPLLNKACSLQDTGKFVILLPYIHVVLDLEKGAKLFTPVLCSSKEHDEMVERFDCVFNSVYV